MMQYRFCPRLIMLAATLMAAMPAQAVKHIHISDPEPENAAPARTSCRGRLPAKAEVAAFGVYEGRRTTNYAIGSSPHATGLISIVGSAKGPRRTLLLMAYEPVLWDFSNAPVGRISGVILSGAQDQAALNLPASIPLLISAARPRSAPCAPIGYAYKGGPQLDRVAIALEDATGLSLASFDGAYNVISLRLTDRLLADPAQPPQGAGRIRANATMTKTPVRPGAEGINELLASGAIRTAQRADIDRWNASATRRLRTGTLAPYRSEHLTTSRAYVVTRAITVPRGMYGAHLANFILLPGVPMPRDVGSHNSYFLPDGTCKGVMPECARPPSMRPPPQRPPPPATRSMPPPPMVSLPSQSVPAGPPGWVQRPPR